MFLIVNQIQTSFSNFQIHNILTSNLNLKNKLRNKINSYLNLNLNKNIQNLKQKKKKKFKLTESQMMKFNFALSFSAKKMRLAYLLII